MCLTLTEEDAAIEESVLFFPKSYERVKKIRQPSDIVQNEVGPKFVYKDIESRRYVGIIMERPYDAECGVFDPSEGDNVSEFRTSLRESVEWIVLSNLALEAGDWILNFAKNLDNFIAGPNVPMYLLTDANEIEETLRARTRSQFGWNFQKYPKRFAGTRMIMIGKREVFDGLQLNSLRAIPPRQVDCSCGYDARYLEDLFRHRYYGENIKPKSKDIHIEIHFHDLDGPVVDDQDGGGDQAGVGDMAKRLETIDIKGETVQAPDVRQETLLLAMDDVLNTALESVREEFRRLMEQYANPLAELKDD